MEGSTFTNVLGILVLIIALGGLIYTFYSIALWIITSSYKKKAFSLLTNGFNSRVVIDEKEIKAIYNRYIDKSVSYGSFIEEYLLHFRDWVTPQINDYQKVHDTLQAIIDREQVSDPYSGIDEQKKKNLIAIEKAVNSNVPPEIIKENLESLSQAIRSTEIRLKKSKSLNAWTIPLAVIGLVFTLLSYFGGTKLSDKDLQKFNKSVSSAVYRALDSLSTNQSDKTLNLMEEKENNQ